MGSEKKYLNSEHLEVKTIIHKCIEANIKHYYRIKEISILRKKILFVKIWLEKLLNQYERFATSSHDHYCISNINYLLGIIESILKDNLEIYNERRQLENILSGIDKIILHINSPEAFEYDEVLHDIDIKPIENATENSTIIKELSKVNYANTLGNNLKLPQKKKILILISDPNDKIRLRVSYEVKEIRQMLKMALNKDLYEVRDSLCTTTKDFRREILEYKPDIVHFAGHGNKEGIVLENSEGDSITADYDSLSMLFKHFKEFIQCVFLNCCYSDSQVEAISNNIDFVICMNDQVDDKSAVEFAGSFYQSLCSGSNVEESFEYAKIGLRMDKLPGDDIPQLKKKG